MKKNVSSAEIVTDLSVGFSEVLPLARETGKRSIGQYQTLRRAMQMVVDNKHFEIKPLTLKNMLLSDDPKLVAEAWDTLYHKWGFDHDAGPGTYYFDPNSGYYGELRRTNIRSYLEKYDAIPLYISPKLNWENYGNLEQVITGKREIRWSKIHFEQTCKNSMDGWYFISGSAKPPAKKVDTNFCCDYMNILSFLLFFGLSQVVHSRSRLEGIQTELLPFSKYREKPLYVSYADFKSFTISNEPPLDVKSIKERFLSI